MQKLDRYSMFLVLKPESDLQIDCLLYAISVVFQPFDGG